MNYSILHTVSYSGPDRKHNKKHTLTVEVRGDTLRVNRQGYLLVEYIRKDENGNRYTTVSAVFKDWESAVQIKEYYSSSCSSSSSSDARKPGKVMLSRGESEMKPTIEVKKPSIKEPDTGCGG